MLPVLETGDMLFVSPLAYGLRAFDGYAIWHEPARGDLVLFRTPYFDEPGLLERLLQFLGRIFLFGNVLSIEADPSPLEKQGYQIRRIIGIPGDRIEFRDGYWQILPGGETEARSELVLSEQIYAPQPFLRSSAESGPFGVNGWPTTVEPGEYFVAAEDRGGPLDSRHYGPIPLEDLLGMVVLRYGPTGRFGGP